MTKIGTEIEMISFKIDDEVAVCFGDKEVVIFDTPSEVRLTPEQFRAIVRAYETSLDLERIARRTNVLRDPFGAPDSDAPDTEEGDAVWDFMEDYGPAPENPDTDPGDAMDLRDMEEMLELERERRTEAETRVRALERRIALILEEAP